MRPDSTILHSRQAAPCVLVLARTVDRARRATALAALARVPPVGPLLGASTHRRFVSGAPVLSRVLRTARSPWLRDLLVGAPRERGQGGGSALFEQVEVIELKSFGELRRQFDQPELMRALAAQEQALAAHGVHTHVALCRQHSLVCDDAVASKAAVLLFLQRRHDQTRAQMHAYWLHSHAPLVLGLRGALGFSGYRQLQRADDASAWPIASWVSARFDGIACMSFPRMRQLERALCSWRSHSANLELMRDEPRFIDVDRATPVLGIEHGWSPRAQPIGGAMREVQQTANPPKRPQPTFRRMQFPLGSPDKHWANDSIGISHFWNVLSCAFPRAERFFIDAVGDLERPTLDPRLERDLAAFVAQEGHHGHHHKRLNEVLRGAGLELERYERWFRQVLDAMERGLDAPTRLAVTMALEHFAAVFSAHYLTDTQPSQGAPPALDALWSWHASEEIEHKAVCFDLYQAMGGGYARRALAMVAVSPLLFSLVLAAQIDLVRRDRAGLTRNDALRTLRYMVGKRGVLTRAVGATLRYLRPGFHPWEFDDLSLLADASVRYTGYLAAERARAA